MTTCMLTLFNDCQQVQIEKKVIEIMLSQEKLKLMKNLAHF